MRLLKLGDGIEPRDPGTSAGNARERFTCCCVGRRRWLIGSFATLVVVPGLFVGLRWRSTRAGASSSAPRVPRLGPFPTTIVRGIHLLGGLAPATAYVVETSEGPVLIDSGLDADAALLKKEMAELGLDWQRLRAILLTHVHGDHSGGTRHLRAATGATVHVGQSDAAPLRAGEPREAFFSAFYTPDASASPTLVDVELKGDEAIVVGDVRFQTLATPGHTPGSISYLVEREDVRALFSGDVIMALAGDPRSQSKLARPLGTYATYLAPRYRGNAKAFLSSLRKLRALPPPDLVLPGHPRLDRAPQSPAVSHDRWYALLEEGISEMETLQGRYEHDGANFLDGVSKQLLPGLHYLGEFEGTAVYSLFAASKLFLVHAPGGLGLFDFVHARLRELGVTPTAPTAVMLTAVGPGEMAGLKELVERTHLAVVASRVALRKLETWRPPGTVLVPAEDLPRKDWIDVTPVPLGGQEVAPIAYDLRWAGKRVLFSGRIPIKVNQVAVARLLADYSASSGSIVGYGAALNQLGNLNPDLWLPAVPSEGQNANLYDGEWENIIASNRKLLR